MTKSPPLTLDQIDARLNAQTSELETLRTSLAVQFTRIAQMQAELDALLPRRKREVRSTHLLQMPSRNGNGHSQR